MEWYQLQNQDSKCTSSIDDLHEVYKFYHHLINMKPLCTCNKKKKRKLHQRYIVFDNLVHLNVFENSVNDFSNGNVSLVLRCFPQSIVCRN